MSKRMNIPPPLDSGLFIPGDLWDAPSDNLQLLDWKESKRQLQQNQEDENNQQQQQQQQYPEEPMNDEEIKDSSSSVESSLVTKGTTTAFSEEGSFHPLGSQINRLGKLDFTACQGAPLLMTSVEGDSKVALNALYGKLYSVAVTNASFICWDDGRLPHERGYTCVFVCPVTYEIFPTGRCLSTATTKSGKKIDMWVGNDKILNHCDDIETKDNDDDDVVTDTPPPSLVWYSRKMEATQGAAALRYDCWYYRRWVENNPNAPKMRLFGLDEPYTSPEDPWPQRVIQSIPDKVMERIQTVISKWKEEAAAREMEIDRESLVEVENSDYRNAYLQSRQGYNNGNDNSFIMEDDNGS